MIYSGLSEGDSVPIMKSCGSHALHLKVLYVEGDIIHLRPYFTLDNLTFKLDTRTHKIYKWTPTGWDTTDWRVQPCSDEGFMGD